MSFEETAVTICKQVARSHSEENKKLVDRQMECLVRVSTEQGLYKYFGRI